jgi:chaperone required for assembly of F1-ATPase
MIDPEGGPPPAKRGLPKRFYTQVSVTETAGACHILLDGRSVRTPGKRLLALPGAALAEAVAAEWRAQGAVIDPTTMPLTRIVNAALDGVAGREAEVRADVVKYAGSDLLCYRAEGPPELVERQRRHWDPLIAWASSSIGCRLKIAHGVMPLRQSEEMLERLAARIAGLDALRLAALHVATTLTGSALLALALAEGRIDRQEAWAAAQVDEDFQVEQWGEDGEAVARARVRRAELDAASRVLELSAPR